MSKQYKALAAQILEGVGGKENVSNLYHCQTRLRFTLKDNQKADTAAVEALDGVRKVLISGGYYQVVIGTNVAEVCEEIEPLLDKAAVKTDAEEAPKEKLNPAEAVINFVAGTFQPVIRHCPVQVCSRLCWRCSRSLTLWTAHPRHIISSTSLRMRYSTFCPLCLPSPRRRSSNAIQFWQPPLRAL